MASVMPRAAIGLQILLLLCAKQATGDCTLGKATFYYPADQPGRGTGSCGTSISDTDLVGALGCALLCVGGLIMSPRLAHITHIILIHAAQARIRVKQRSCSFQSDLVATPCINRICCIYAVHACRARARARALCCAMPVMFSMISRRVTHASDGFNTALCSVCAIRAM